MNSLDNKSGFHSVRNRLDYMSLKTIYEVGRNTSDNHYEGFNDIISTNKKNALLKVIKPLYDFLLLDHVNFYPLFIEFALFDPTNVSGNKFYSVLTSPYDELFEGYLTEMKNNVHYRGGGGKRGPLIPNEGLYKYTYYRLSKETNRYFSPHSVHELNVKFGCFNIQAQKSDKGRKIENYVNAFLSETLRKFKDNTALSDKKDGKELNHSMLIPLFRPAAPTNTDIEQREEIFRGGGLFIYGCCGKNFNESSFVLEIRTFLMKSILEASHTEIEVEKMKSLQADLELHLYHHFGSNLRTLPDLLNLNNFGSENLNSFQKEIIKTAKSYIKGHIDSTRSVLNSYQQYLDNDGVAPNYKLSLLFDEFTYLKEEIKQQQQLWGIDAKRIKLSKKNVTGDEVVPLAPNIFRNFLEQFYHNAIKAYDEIETKLEKRNIKIKVIKKKEIIEFSFFNSNTEIDPFVLTRAGLKPIKSVNSSGLGYYFLNFSLKLCKAEKNSENKYFILGNNKSPKGVFLSFSFKIKKNEKQENSMLK